MSSQTLTAADVEAIKALDFDLACSCRIPITAPQCTRPAAWLMIKRCGHAGYACDSCKIKTAAPPYDELMACLVCRHTWSIRELEWKRL